MATPTPEQIEARRAYMRNYRRKYDVVGNASEKNRSRIRQDIVDYLERFPYATAKEIEVEIRGDAALIRAVLRSMLDDGTVIRSTYRSGHRGRPSYIHRLDGYPEYRSPETGDDVEGVA